MRGRGGVSSRRLTLLGSIVVLLAASGSGTAGRPGAEPIRGASAKRAGSITSTFWSGYAVFGRTFTDVKGTWTQPAANCSGLGQGTKTTSAFWIGLDGYDSNTVEQAGTEANCNGTSASYFAWYEFYPAKFTPLDTSVYPVAAGDSLSIEVSQDGTIVSITFSNPTKGWTLSVSTSAAKLAFSSAEWIAEGLTHNLTNFGTVSFSGSTASDGTVTNGGIDNSEWSNSDITMIDHGGQNTTSRAVPTGLSRHGTAFSVNWQHS